MGWSEWLEGLEVASLVFTLKRPNFQERKILPRHERASLWEIEPPTEDERRLYTLMDQAAMAKTKEESGVLAAQAQALAKQMRAVEENVKRADEKPKMCYVCYIRPALAASAFCSPICAQTAAERMVQMTSRGWCTICERWVDAEGCPHFLQSVWQEVMVAQ